MSEPEQSLQGNEERAPDDAPQAVLGTPEVQTVRSESGSDNGVGTHHQGVEDDILGWASPTSDPADIPNEMYTARDDPNVSFNIDMRSTDAIPNFIEDNAALLDEAAVPAGEITAPTLQLRPPTEITVHDLHGGSGVEHEDEAVLFERNDNSTDEAAASAPAARSVLPTEGTTHHQLLSQEPFMVGPISAEPHDHRPLKSYGETEGGTDGESSQLIPVAEAVPFEVQRGHYDAVDFKELGLDIQPATPVPGSQKGNTSETHLTPTTGTPTPSTGPVQPPHRPVEVEEPRLRKRTLCCAPFILLIALVGLFFIVNTFADIVDLGGGEGNPSRTVAPQDFSPSTSPSPPSAPTSTIPSPTTSPILCFETKEELQSALSTYFQEGETQALVDRYGWIGDWCVSKITDFTGLFQDQETFNGPIENWDTSSVTTMREVFRGAKAFNRDISNWSTSRVTDMYRAFRDASSFNQTLSSWDTSSVTTMYAMVCLHNQLEKVICQLCNSTSVFSLCFVAVLWG